ncbi:MAG TPA: serine/threonine-protein kinase [Gemmatimonadaceae bacterium]|jgi:hypothetical protein
MDIRDGTKLDGPDGKTITIEKYLGGGGFGQVFKGVLNDSTEVAVKTVLTSVLQEDELRALQNEAKHAVGITHPNVVRVLYVNDGEAFVGVPPYLVMEYVDGGTLRDVIDGHRSAGTKIPPDELRAIYLQIATGMAAVSARIVHRDLKPENILIDAATKNLKIADFGLAKLADAATRSETFKGWGTRPYQAPEAFEGGPNTGAMDIYAAGVVFYELATLEWPIRPKPGADGPLAWRNAHLLTAPKDVRALRPDLPDDLVQLVMQALQKNPAKRPTSFTAIGDRLKAGATPRKGPDVSALVSKATSTFIQKTEAEIRLRAEKERRTERAALLQQAFAEPLEILKSVVDAFNHSSDVAKLEIRPIGELAVEVRGGLGYRGLLLDARIIEDIDASRSGVVRMVGSARLDPQPEARDQRDYVSSLSSFGGFNVFYRVASSEQRFGDWSQIRFELNPLLRKTSYPHWFALSLQDGELPRQLQMLNVLGEYQHEQRALDDEWFKALLLQML